MYRVDIQQTPVKILDYCAGCGCGIEEGEEYLEELDGSRVHNDPFCCQEYIARESKKRVYEPEYELL